MIQKLYHFIVSECVSEIFIFSTNVSSLEMLKWKFLFLTKQEKSIDINLYINLPTNHKKVLKIN